MSEPVTNDDVALETFTKNGTKSTSQFRFGRYYILASCYRVTDKKQIARYTADYGIERPAANHTIKALGFRIYIDDEKAEIFRYSKKPIEVGAQRWAFSIRRSSVQSVVVYGLSLQIYEADSPNRVDFTTQSAIDAALDVYRTAVDRAELELRQELLRISMNAARQIRSPESRPEKPNNPNQVRKSVVKEIEVETVAPRKQLVRFKRRI